MRRRFFIGSVGQPNEGYDEENLERCIKYIAHIMHEETTQKGVFDQVEKGDIIFLKYRHKLIAFGEVSSRVILDDASLNGWTYQIKVKKWFFYSDNNASDGINRYGVADHIVKGSQYATIKEIDMEFAMKKMKEVSGENNELYTKIRNEIIYNHLVGLLISNHNLILTGAPGTGKTYITKKIAEAIGADGNHRGFVQFHPSYDYTDFIEGLRPIHREGSSEIGFERKDGIFLEFCRKALKAPEENFVFIIDEINRGEISKVFGELFFSIDDGYRGKDGMVSTQYSNLWEEKDYFDDSLTGDERKMFYVPNNVYIIGTMNDIDRSVESMDFAMRRRFAWYEIKAKDRQDMLDEAEAWPGNTLPDQEIVNQAKKRMDKLNDAIVSKDVGLTESYHIGASYFLKLGNYLDNENPFNQLWEMHLKGLLYEYLRGIPHFEEKLGKLKEAYDNWNDDESNNNN